MRIDWLAWYICGVLSLLALLTSAITYHPDVEHLGVVLPAIFGGGAILVGGLAAGLVVLPANHRIHHSRPVWAAFVAAAVTATLLLVLVG